MAKERVSGGLNNLGKLLYDFMDEENWAHPIWLQICDFVSGMDESQINKLLTETALVNEHTMDYLLQISRGLIPLKPDYNYGAAIEESNKYIFFDIDKDVFVKLDGKQISDYIELGKLAYEEQIDVNCLDPFSVLAKLREVK
jgi:hypothetical protein